MNTEHILHITDRKQWRAWLSKNHTKETSVWLAYFRKETGKPRISYNDAVEEALCFGWIDSNVKSLDKERYIQKFSVRKQNSNLSQMNKERLSSLIAQTKMTKAGLDAVAHVFSPTSDRAKKLIIASDILKALKANKLAWSNFKKFPEPYKRIRVAFIESRRRHGDDMFVKSLNHFIKMTSHNKRFGFVKEMRYDER
jgi:uncharacterized protein YdeI (YjbR/CyaY-like superfamily)